MRSKQHDQHEDHIRSERAQSIRQVDGAESLGDADDEPSQHDTDEICHAAEHYDQQRYDRIAESLRRLDRRSRQQQRRGDREAPDTEREGQRPTSIPISAAAWAF